MPIRLHRPLVLAACLLLVATGSAIADARSKPYLKAARAFADTVLSHGRDTYGNQKTPLFVDGLHAGTLEPVRWKKDGETWVLSNLASQQPLMRLLDGLTALTGDARYRRAAEETARYALAHLQAPNGLLYWGGHAAWDLDGDKAIGQYGSTIHELKGHQPYYRLMWRVDPERTRQLLGAVWAGHVLDWSTLDYNRHASTKKDVKAPWDHAFNDSLDVPFPTKGGNLSFANVTPPLMYAGTMLGILGKDENALVWTRRLAWRWQQGRHPKTGLCGGQLSYRKQDRAQEALGHVHPDINEAKIVASYHQTCRYHSLPLAQMQAGEALVATGGKAAEVGRQFIRWASDDLKTYADRCWDDEAGVFVTCQTDGTPLDWKKARTGYYTPSSFAPRRPDGTLFWGYATAYRLTRDESHWRMVRRIAKDRGLGDVGRPDGTDRDLLADPNSADGEAIYTLLELRAATGDAAFLAAARGVADNLLARQTKTGLFPNAKAAYARTGDEAPLALLHVAGAIEGKRDALPRAVFDRRFFHCVYEGPLDEHQKKRADSRTYDSRVFYGG